jgi:hypothetical protein
VAPRAYNEAIHHARVKVGGLRRRQWEADNPGKVWTFNRLPAAAPRYTIQQALRKIECDVHAARRSLVIRAWGVGRFTDFIDGLIAQYKYADGSPNPVRVWKEMVDNIPRWYFAVEDLIERDRQLEYVLDTLYTLPTKAVGKTSMFGQMKAMYHQEKLVNTNNIQLQHTKKHKLDDRVRYYVMYQFTAVVSNRRRYQAKVREKILAFAMGSHARLGAGTLIRVIDNNVLLLIGESAWTL